MFVRRTRAVLACAGMVAACAVAAPAASAESCPSVDDDYNGACGPWFNLPAWTDAAGWTDASQYATIQLGDVNGDGAQELIGRSAAGVAVHRFDTTVGQWRPQVTAAGLPVLLDDFVSPRPQDEANPQAITQPQYYSTIQAADVDGIRGAEIIARFWDGLRVYKYTPPAGGTAIDGGTWTRIGTAGPFSDADGYGDPSLYSTIGVGRFRMGDPPLLFARRHTGTETDQPLVFYKWGSSGWTPVTMDYDSDGSMFDVNDGNCKDPSCYLTLQTGNMMPGAQGDSKDISEFLGRTAGGVGIWDYQPDGRWGLLNFDEDVTTDGLPPYDDLPGGLGPDCPFSVQGATGDGSNDCVGSSPSYYETLKAANIDGVGADELIVRASDGLRVRQWQPGPDGGKWIQLQTMPWVSGGPSSIDPGKWGSIRTGDINSDGAEEVLFMDGEQLQAAWFARPTQQWMDFGIEPDLKLNADPWFSGPEYYSTLQVGDVDGDGQADVLARGPSGIRTWFHNRTGTGGWGPYLQPGYPQFSGAQANAYAKLTDLAKDNSYVVQSATAVRDLWASENAPAQAAVTTVKSALAGVAGCDAKTVSGSPPSYGSCTTPANYTGDFTDADWTAVVNQTLAEAFYAEQVLTFFSDLGDVRQSYFLQNQAVLPAIGDALQLPAAAGVNAQYSPQGLFAGIVGIAASVVGVAEPEISAGLWIGSEIASMIPSSSPTASGPSLQSDYAGLEGKLAQMSQEAAKGQSVQSQQVRQDYGLLRVVGEMYARGTWQLDKNGLESAANQAFATWVYRTLLPDVFERYQISGCRDYTGFVPAGGINQGLSMHCIAPPQQDGVDTIDSQTFISLGQAHSQDNYPCYEVYSKLVCAYDRVPDAKLSSQVWGEVDFNCDYVPGKSTTIWTFGKCSAGVDVRTSVVANTWGFPNNVGAPDPPGAFDCMIKNGCAIGSRSEGAAPVRFKRTRAGMRGSAELRTELGTLRGKRLAGATLRIDRLLFEEGHGELTSASRKARPLTLRLSRAGKGRFVAKAKGRVTVELRRGRDGRVRVTLSGARVRHVPRACRALPASVAEPATAWLHSRLVIRAEGAGVPVRVSQHLRCRRDGSGEVARLERVRFGRTASRPGLAVSVRGPKAVRAGGRATYRARVSNRAEASFWDVRVTGAAKTTRIRELRRGKSRTVAFSVRVPHNARGRVCVRFAAAAPAAKEAREHVCPPVRLR